MNKNQGDYKHNASDKALDAAAQSDEGQTDASSHKHPGHHDDEAIRKHDDKGHDRMFEGREQHDVADLKSEKSRLTKDQARHGHPVEGEDAVTESNMHVKRKN